MIFFSYVQVISMKLHIAQCMICLLAFSDAALINSTTSTMQCSREELSASGLGIDARGKLALHDYTSRSLSELLKNIPPSVFEDVKVRTIGVSKII